jgi:PTS system nitrogen regulatory IIA component
VSIEHEIMTLPEVAKHLGVSERTIYDWAQKGKIPAAKLGNAWRFKRSEINRWKETRKKT